MSTRDSKQNHSLFTQYRELYIRFAQPRWDIGFVMALLVGETLLSALIVWKVPYTEIDWIAYMEEVDFWKAGEYDYRKIYGNTGPLVYPAGFLYLFGALQDWTDRHVAVAQVYFVGFYIALQGVVLVLYTTVLRQLTAKGTTTNQERQWQQSHTVWSWRLAMSCLCLSKRLHSIFLLRLFNDGPTMLVAYMSFYLFMTHRWNLGCLVFSVAVSLKMNVLLFAPGLLCLLLQESPRRTIPRLAICAVSQVLIGAPFLLRHPVSYLRKAFELDRQFFFQWTVNFKFLPESVFLSKSLALVLVTLHLGLLGVYAWRQRNKFSKSGKPQSPQHILSTLLISNLVGIVCARTLHYQFYSWYVSGLPYLLWLHTPYPLLLRLALLAAIEYAFLTFPATPLSSGVLQVAHWAILLPCLIGSRRQEPPTNKGD